MPNDVEILVDRIGGTLVPRRLDALLCRQELHELAELAAQEAPAFLAVAYERMRFVLRQYSDAADPGVDAVREREIDDAEFSAERDCRFGAPRRQLLKSGSLTAGKNER